jgi:hypothetical protein
MKLVKDQVVVRVQVSSLNLVRNQNWEQVRGQILNQAWDQVWDQVRDHINFELKK